MWHRYNTGVYITYEFDALGALRSVKSTGFVTKLIEYVVDGLGRRIGKKLNGVMVKQWRYGRGNAPIAELDGNGNVTMRFVYGSRASTPDYIRTYPDNKSYRVFADQLGTPRMLYDVAAGTVAKTLEFDEFGVRTSVTNPSFEIPFGFAGGLYDADTGLTRFGAREYDAGIGRWVSKDPILFGGRQANLYVYVLNDPLNWVDPTGLLEGVPDWLEDLDNSGWLQAAGDFSAGASSALTFGLSDQLIGATGLGQYGSVCSSAYRAGEYATYALAAARLGYAGLAKAGSLAFRAPTVANLGRAVGFRNGLKVAFRLGVSRARVYTTSEVLARYGGDVAEAIAASGRTDSFLNAYSAAILAYGAGN